MGISGESHVTGARDLIAALDAGAAAVQQLLPQVVEKSAADLVALTQLNASHRPGPNAPTGDYRGSWREEEVPDQPGSSSWSVGTDRAQANRLEYGFVGRDSLGREYDQQPYPHHGPAVDVIEPNFQAAMAKVAELAVRW